MPKDYRKQIENLRERARESDDISDADSDALLAFSDRLDLLAQDYTDIRHKTLLGKLVRMAERHGGLNDALSSKDAAEDIVRWINRTYENEETNRDHRSALRVFGKRLAETRDDIETDSDDMPVSLAWVSSGTSSDYDPTPDPRDMLRWTEDIVPMIEETYNDRDAAMIALQFDAGLRGGEFKDATLGDIQDHKHGLQITVEGKRGRRTVTLITSVPYVNDWLSSHPADRSESDAPLWSALHSVDSISDKMIYKALNKAADRAGVSRPVTLTNFRKSSAAFLASRGVNQATLEDHHGWVRGSRAAARYIAVFDEDRDREIARAHGVEISEEEEPDPTAPIPCPRCSVDVPRHEPFCDDCGQAMTVQAAQELAAAERAGQQTLANLPPGEDAQALLDLLARLGADVDMARRTLGLSD